MCTSLVGKSLIKYPKIVLNWIMLEVNLAVLNETKLFNKIKFQFDTASCLCTAVMQNYMDNMFHLVPIIHV